MSAKLIAYHNTARQRMLQDIAGLCGGRIVSEDLGNKLENTTLNDLDRCKTVKIDKDNTTIIEADTSDRLLGDWLHKSVAVIGIISERLDGKLLLRVLSVQSIADTDLHQVPSK